MTSCGVCLSVCLVSVTSVIVSKRINISSDFVYHSSFSVRNLMLIFWRRLPWWGVKYRWGTKKSRFVTNISLYLGNDTNRATVTMEWNANRKLYPRYRMILSDLAKYSMKRSTHGVSATAELLVLTLVCEVYCDAVCFVCRFWCGWLASAIHIDYIVTHSVSSIE